MIAAAPVSFCGVSVGYYTFPLGHAIRYEDSGTDGYSCEWHTYTVDGSPLTVKILVRLRDIEDVVRAGIVDRRFVARPVATVQAERVERLEAAVVAACQALWGPGKLVAAGSATGVIAACHAASLEWR